MKKFLCLGFVNKYVCRSHRPNFYKCLCIYMYIFIKTMCVVLQDCLLV